MNHPDNAAGDSISVTDPRANITTSTYDAARRQRILEMRLLRTEARQNDASK